MGARISVMQPYLAPYAGYFRLLCDVDVFVVLDEVQFPRRGWVHRNRLRLHNGSLGWLTLPLAYAPQDTPILRLEFAPDAEAWTRGVLRRFAALKAPGPQVRECLPLIAAAETPCDSLIRLTARFSAALGMTAPVLRQSALSLPAGLKGVERIHEICRLLGADRYVNSPGGRDLYDPADFRRRGVELQLLPDYHGPMDSILQRLHDTPAQAIAAEIRANL